MKKFIFILFIFNTSLAYSGEMNFAYNKVTGDIVSRNYSNGKLETCNSQGICTDLCINPNIVCAYNQPIEKQNEAIEDMKYDVLNKRFNVNSKISRRNREDKEKRLFLRERIVGLKVKKDKADSLGYTFVSAKLQNKINELISRLP